MPTTFQNDARNRRPSLQVVVIAVLQLIVAVPLVFLCGITLWAIFRTPEIPRSVVDASVFGVLFCLSFLAVITSIGLLRLKNWARRASLLLITISTFSCAALLVFYHPQVAWGRSTIDSPYDPIRGIAKLLLVVLVFMSLVYWLLFTSASVCYEFEAAEKER